MEDGIQSRSTKHATVILFSCKKYSPNHPQLIFNGTAVNKHLGLILEPGLSFEKHLSEKISKAKKIGILKHLSKFLPLNTLDHLYNLSFILILITAMSFIIYHLSKIHLPPLVVPSIP